MGRKQPRQRPKALSQSVQRSEEARGRQSGQRSQFLIWGEPSSPETEGTHPFPSTWREHHRDVELRLALPTSPQILITLRMLFLALFLCLLFFLSLPALHPTCPSPLPSASVPLSGSVVLNEIVTAAQCSTGTLYAHFNLCIKMNM